MLFRSQARCATTPLAPGLVPGPSCSAPKIQCSAQSHAAWYRRLSPCRRFIAGLFTARTLQSSR